MALSSTIVAELKKKTVTARKKDLAFFFFEKGEDKKPTLILGLKATARQEKDELVAKLKRAPTARGVLRKNDATDGLYFRIETGSGSALKKALKSTYKGIPLLKSAAILNKAPAPEDGAPSDAPAPELLSRMDALLKGGPRAFARRADKVGAELDEIADLLKRGDFPKLRARHRTLAKQLAGARAAAKKSPKSAYAALKTVKDRARKLTQAAQAAVKIAPRLQAVKARLRADLTTDKIINQSVPICSDFMRYLRDDVHNHQPMAFFQDLTGGMSARDVLIKYAIIDQNDTVRPNGDWEVNIGKKSLQKLQTIGWGALTAADVTSQCLHEIIGDIGPLAVESSMMGQYKNKRFPFKDFQITGLDINNIDDYNAQLKTWKGLLGM